MLLKFVKSLSVDADLKYNKFILFAIKASPVLFKALPTDLSTDSNRMRKISNAGCNPLTSGTQMRQQDSVRRRYSLLKVKQTSL